MYTVDVIVAAALARSDLQALQAEVELSLRFTLLAAADSEALRFPRDGWHDRQQLLKVAIDQAAGQLRLTFQALGYAAMVRIAGRLARIADDSGAVDVTFRFDSTGRGVVALADTPEIRHALADFAIVLD
ncbi:hypothetical protein [Rhodopseudomonas palustris]|uniref:hypothetical protein n=1 Tax=Rhodopseudomonas palustris TaxID=1076 RepID=UPI0021F31098|nr:hypothetical protein [Rhodopseudomonas palustris]UYO54596.1 hypothetical protein KQX61_04010 [Rhodopseudomonas palustris]